MTYETALAEFEQRAAADRDYHARAARIVDRVLPELPIAHGFYQPHDFIAAARRRGDRKYLEWMIYARLRAKAEGGKPHISLPKGAEAAMKGGAMWRAAKAIESDCAGAWEQLRAYIANERMV